MAVLTGSAKLDTGDRATLVLIRDWDSFVHVATVIPGTDGGWTASVVDGRRFEVTVRGPVGYQPVSHGPITPEASA